MSAVDFRIRGSETKHEELDEMVFRLERDCWDEYVIDAKRVTDRPLEWVLTPGRYWVEYALLHETGHAFLTWAPNISKRQVPSVDVSNEIIFREPTEVSKRRLFGDDTEAYFPLILDEANASSSVFLWSEFDRQRLLVDPVPTFHWGDGFRELLNSFEMLRSQRGFAVGAKVAYYYTGESDEEAKWTEEKNQRRCDLVEKEIDGTLSPEEAVELENLQQEMLAYRREIAPLPIEEARRVHDALLKRAAEKKE
jgi:hypothetical protein